MDLGLSWLLQRIHLHRATKESEDQLALRRFSPYVPSSVQVAIQK
jgi:hypothetical protein